VVHESKAAEFLPRLRVELSEVEFFADPKAFKIFGKSKQIKKATSKSWDTEYLDLKMNCAVVKSLQEALEHIDKHGSKHSEAIITNSDVNAHKFMSCVDAAAVYWNASTRFTDGFALGLGGELGISTQKLHVRGPVGLEELTSTYWHIEGQGQIR
jgi:glutamate-5-semialdehyde dehydrogenase